MKLKITGFVLVLLLLVLGAGHGPAASSADEASGGSGLEKPQLAPAFALLKKGLAAARKNGGSADIAVPSRDGADRVEAGDLATVDYTARLADGTLVASTLDTGQAEMVLAGKPASFPMLGEAVVGMEREGAKRLTISPAAGFGVRTPDKVKTFPVRQEISQTEQIPLEEAGRLLGSKPEPGMELRILPFFKSRITEIDGKTVTVRHLAKDNSEIDTPLGKTSVSLVNDKILLVLHPKIGAPFFRQGRRGVITAADDKGFSVDFNHPLAGKTITLDLKVIKIRKKAQLAYLGPITWQKSLQGARELAKRRHKPLFLFLYADWCPWCKRLDKEVLTDARIRLLEDDFVWIRLNSGKEKHYQKEFRQRGFPLIVLLDEDGRPVSRIDGFQNAAALRRGLLDWLSSRKQG